MGKHFVKQFPYDLWEADGRCWARIRSTGEEVEISREVLRELNRQEKETYRETEIKETDDLGKDELRAYLIRHPLSLDVPTSESDDANMPSWIVNRSTPETETAAAELERLLISHLTERQRDCYFCCMVSGETKASYAERTGISERRVNQIFVQIRQKYIFLTSTYSEIELGCPLDGEGERKPQPNGTSSPAP